jgi:ankyrin repeat protein
MAIKQVEGPAVPHRGPDDQPGAARGAELLIDRGAIIDARDAEERTALGVAAAFGHAGLVSMLLEHGADPNALALGSCGRPLLSAAKLGNLSIAELLLSKGTGIQETGDGGTTVLHGAIQYPSLCVVQLLVAYGANAFLPDGQGRSAMQYAMAHGDSRLVAALLGEPEGR